MSAWLAASSRGASVRSRARTASRSSAAIRRADRCPSRVQMLGHVPRGKALARSGARAGDALFLSGTAGDAAAGLALEAGPARARRCRRRGRAARALLLSDAARRARTRRCAATRAPASTSRTGCWAMPAKLAAASGCGVEIAFDEAAAFGMRSCAPSGMERARHLALTGGEDYELCFAVPRGADRGARARAAAGALAVSAHRHAARPPGRARHARRDCDAVLAFGLRSFRALRHARSARTDALPRVGSAQPLG